MSDKVQVDLHEVKQVFSYLEDLNAFFHQPLHLEKIEDVHRFLQDGGYEKISKMYYDIVWNWLPPEVQHEIEERDSLVGERG